MCTSCKSEQNSIVIAVCSAQTITVLTDYQPMANPHFTLTLSQKIRSKFMRTSYTIR